MPSYHLSVKRNIIFRLPLQLSVARLATMHINSFEPYLLLLLWVTGTEHILLGELSR